MKVSSLNRIASYKASIPDKKTKRAQEICDLTNKYPTIALANISGLPAAQLQEIKKKLRSKAVITTCKRSVNEFAFKNCTKKEVSKLLDYAEGPYMLIFSEENPFTIFSLAEKNQSKALAKAGQVATEDIVVPEGDTGFPPGPILSDLKVAGLDVAPMGGTIKIRSDSRVAKAGEVISDRVANALGKLKIKPMKIGLNITAAFDNGVIYGADVLRIDSDEVFGNFKSAASGAFNLSVNAKIFNKQSVEFLISKASRESNAVALDANIFTSETMPAILAKAQRQLASVASQLSAEAAGGAAGMATTAPAESTSEAPSEEKKEEKSEDTEKKAEENAAAGMGALFG